MRRPIWLLALTQTLYISPCSFISNSKAKGFEIIGVGDGSEKAFEALGKPSATENSSGARRRLKEKLGGGEVPTPAVRIEAPFPTPPTQSANPAIIQAGEVKFIEECSRCHVLGPSSTPDLRRLNAGLHATFKDIVLRGALAPNGMERFDDLLGEQDVDNIHAYLIDQSWMTYCAQEVASH